MHSAPRQQRTNRHTILNKMQSMRFLTVDKAHNTTRCLKQNRRRMSLGYIDCDNKEKKATVKNHQFVDF